MASRISRAELGRANGRRQRTAIGSDIRTARFGAGVSIERAARSVGLSPTMFGRIERGVLDTATLEQLSLACSAVGLRFAGRAYPGGPGVRDAKHAELLRRFRERLLPGVPWLTEVPIRGGGDLRAWDGFTVLERIRIAIEAEMRLVDAQALDRRIALKRQDSGISVVILLLPDTHTNRAALAADRGALRANFPLDTRAVLSAVTAGRAPRASGIVVL
jgi:transcriptional regulator with XRE-family HTH domain